VERAALNLATPLVRTKSDRREQHLELHATQIGLQTSLLSRLKVQQTPTN